MTKDIKSHTKSDQDRQEWGQLLTCKEVCERLRINHRTFSAWVKKGYLPAMRLGGQWRVDSGELAAFIRSTHNQAQKAA